MNNTQEKEGTQAPIETTNLNYTPFEKRPPLVSTKEDDEIYINYLIETNKDLDATDILKLRNADDYWEDVKSLISHSLEMRQDFDSLYNYYTSGEGREWR